MAIGSFPAPAEKLYTWVDVEERLALVTESGMAPEWLLEADAWWDGLELRLRNGTEPGAAARWLDEVFGRGSVAEDGSGLVLLLDRADEAQAAGLPVTLILSDEPPEERPVPRLVARRVTPSLAEPLPRPENHTFPGDVQLFAFHSFKGGVGRTLHAVALADRLAQCRHRVLLVDADLEAPGITWMHQAEGGRCEVSYEDVVALLHGSEGGNPTTAVAVAARYLASQQPARYPGNGQVVVLPASRRRRLGPPRIEPADLLTHDRSPYFLTESLASLAEAAELDTVIIDLRAGASELSAPVLLDPRVQRVFVTTLSSQSLDGTERLIRQLGRRAPSWIGTDPAPAAVITQYRLDLHLPSAERARDRLSDALAEAVCGADTDSDLDTDAAPETRSVDAKILTAPVLSPFRDELLALPQTWEAVVDVTRRCDVADALEDLVPPDVVVEAVGVVHEELTLDDRRSQLEKRAGALVYAEQTGFDSGLGFLSTEPLRRLVGDHRTDLPVSVVVGAKGAGKTFTWARLCAAGSWQSFAKQTGEAVHRDAPIIPVLDPANLEEVRAGKGRWSPQALRDRFAENGDGVTGRELRRVLRKHLEDEGARSSDQWLDIWLRCFSLAAGATTEDAADPERFLTSLGARQQALFVLDGLEDLLRSLDTETKRTALWTLLTEVPDWLRSLRSRALGLIVFVRQDLVSWAIRQNLGQFLQRYAAYALRWDSQEALRLALWVAVSAGAVEEPNDPLTDLGAEDIAEHLSELWGLKLGSDKSREAWTERWVPAALADFNEQVQARDVVRFLKEAAGLSVGDDRWDDRVLIPAAMRQALVECSRRKVDEIGQENPELRELFRRMQGYASEVFMPFEADEVALSTKDVQELEDAGALSQDYDGRYRMPEIYRHALGFRTRGRARVVRST